jgi:hypothetical protein
MMRVWILLAALCLAGSASAENVLMKSNGLGAAALGRLGLTVGVNALSGPPAWQGYPKGGDALQFSNDTPGSAPGACASADGGEVAKALKNEPAGSPRSSDQAEGQIHLSEASRQTGGGSQLFDSKAIYSSGQAVTCSSP